MAPPKLKRRPITEQERVEAAAAQFYENPEGYTTELLADVADTCRRTADWWKKKANLFEGGVMSRMERSGARTLVTAANIVELPVDKEYDWDLELLEGFLDTLPEELTKGCIKREPPPPPPPPPKVATVIVLALMRKLGDAGRPIESCYRIVEKPGRLKFTPVARKEAE